MEQGFCVQKRVANGLPEQYFVKHAITAHVDGHSVNNHDNVFVHIKKLSK
jgi:hypothetical protein